MVPKCLWTGEGGPEWDPSWQGDMYGTPTENGFCTNFCKVYDEASSKAVCGDGPWHKTGTDCTGCKAITSELLPPADRAPSSGLCAATESMSGIATWGTAIKECESSENSCTVWQGLNGDSALNPERTCRGFCASFGLQCVNGYDDGDDGCLYGGEGIGCDSVLGCCSVGGPTPDHVCVCEGNVAANPTPLPTVPPTDPPTKSPMKAPTKAPVDPPTTDTPNLSPTMAPKPKCKDVEGKFTATNKKGTKVKTFKCKKMSTKKCHWRDDDGIKLYKYQCPVKCASKIPQKHLDTFWCQFE